MGADGYDRFTLTGGDNEMEETTDVSDDGRLAELPPYIVRRAVDFLRADIPEDVKQIVRTKRAEHGDEWIHRMTELELPGGRVVPRGHFGFGMTVRNRLREGAQIYDAAVPSGNLDDYYIPLVEVACGLREMPREGGA